MELRLYPDPVLRDLSEPVEVFDEALAALAREMTRVMRENNGLGLAGPQVGALKRIFVIAPDAEPGREIVLVNPEIDETAGWEEADEGCLSFPGIYVKVGRFARVVARYQDPSGRPQHLEAEGLLARAVQHELDHLDGRLLVDRMSPVQRMAQRRRLRDLATRYQRRIDQAVRVGGTPEGTDAAD
ncbi:MAG TPA: peptide deformylase [Phycisphaerae bacterium]|nr:peptide deformylase [Phycisphaerae bacterium]